MAIALVEADTALMETATAVAEGAMALAEEAIALAEVMAVLEDTVGEAIAAQVISSLYFEAYTHLLLFEE